MADPTDAETAAAALAASDHGRIFLAELARLTIANTGNLAQAPDADLRAHAGKCALYLHILNMIKRGQGK